MRVIRDQWEKTLEKANKQVRLANSNEPEIKITYTSISIENFLKAILMKKGKYMDDRKRRGGDRHHVCKDLFDKIKRENCLTYSVIEEMERILFEKRLIFMDQKYLEDATPGKFPAIRYTYEVDGEWIDIVEELDPEILNQKYMLLVEFKDLLNKNLK